MTAYLIGAIDIEDEEVYAAYLEGARPLLYDYDVEYLAVDRDPLVLEGNCPARRMFVISFGSLEELQAFHGSEAYRKVATYRHKSGRTHFLIGLRGLEKIRG